MAILKVLNDCENKGKGVKDCFPTPSEVLQRSVSPHLPVLSSRSSLCGIGRPGSVR